MPFTHPSDSQIRALLTRIHHIAILGLSPKSNRPSHHVALHMQSYGYHIIPIRPAIDSILGEPAFANLHAVHTQIDLVNVFRAPQYVDDIVDTCIERMLPALWLQEGVINEAAALRAQQAGIFVVMDRCIYKEYVRLI